MRSIICGLLLAALASPWCPAARATLVTYRLNVSVSYPKGSFWVEFADLDGDSRLSIDELLSFSGFQGYPTLLQVPDKASRDVDGSGSYWVFKSGKRQLRFPWTQSKVSRSVVAEVPPAAVPAPASLPLLLWGLLSLALLRRARPARYAP